MSSWLLKNQRVEFKLVQVFLPPDHILRKIVGSEPVPLLTHIYLWMGMCQMSQGWGRHNSSLPYEAAGLLLFDSLRQGLTMLPRLASTQCLAQASHSTGNSSSRLPTSGIIDIIYTIGKMIFFQMYSYCSLLVQYKIIHFV